VYSNILLQAFACGGFILYHICAEHICIESYKMLLPDSPKVHKFNLKQGTSPTIATEKMVTEINSRERKALGC
jgi:hypothetical protein